MDRYIDQSEARRYNDHTVSTMSALTGLSPEMPLLISQLGAFTARLESTHEAANNTRSALRTTANNRRAQSDHISSRLRILLMTLEAQRAEGGAFDLLRLFPTGSPQDIGRSTADRQAALSRALTGLVQYKDSIQGSQVWIDELAALSASFGQVVTEESAVGQSKRGQSDELSAAYREWKGLYGAAKLIVRGVLRKVGREEEWRDYFLDTQVGGAVTRDATDTSRATSIS